MEIFKAVTDWLTENEIAFYGLFGAYIALLWKPKKRTCKRKRI